MTQDREMRARRFGRFAPGLAGAAVLLLAAPAAAHEAASPAAC